MAYESPVLPPGSHTVTIARSSGDVFLDALEYFVPSLKSAKTNTSLALDEPKLVPEFLIYPNPVKETIGLTVKGIEGTVEISIVSMNGSQVYSNSLSLFDNFKTEISAGEFESGMYMMRITNNNYTDVKQFLIIK